ncbi:hypothetical protein F5884DRAFT_758764 [Xylogone sp. PMI_703]|nr:hypothetical protein F5884DRAFT_758764 [Xylogone sp. PMI_703]
MTTYPILSADQALSQLLSSRAGNNFISKHHHTTYPFIQNSNHVGRSVFITGGSRGIGRSIALSFAKAGVAQIALGDVNDFGDLEDAIRSVTAKNRHNGLKILLFKLDVTARDNVASVAATVQEEFGGKLDILIHNAGYCSPQIPVQDINEDEWWRCFTVNIRGTFHVTKHFLPLLLGTENGLKTIVNLNSVASIGVRPFSSNYAASKAAVLKFSEALLAEEADKGLHVFSIHPGAVLSEMTKVAMPEKLFHLFEDSPELAGDTIAWLTQEPRTWLRGRWLSCNWDMEELMSRRQEIEESDKLKMRLRL